MPAIRHIRPCLWFDSQAEEAANFYVSIFKNSRVTQIARYSEAGFEIHRRPAGSRRWSAPPRDSRLLRNDPRFETCSRS